MTLTCLSETNGESNEIPTPFKRIQLRQVINAALFFVCRVDVEERRKSL